MTSTTAAEAVPATENSPEWTTGDFTLITSDGVTLKTESYYLLAAR